MRDAHSPGGCGSTAGLEGMLIDTGSANFRLLVAREAPTRSFFSGIFGFPGILFLLTVSHFIGPHCAAHGTDQDAGVGNNTG